MTEQAMDFARSALKEQGERIERLEEALRDLALEFRRVFPVYYYAEPWRHETNVPLQNALAILSKSHGGEA